MRKRTLILLVFVAVLFSSMALLIRKCDRDEFTSQSLVDYLPSQSSFSLFIDQPVETWEELREHMIWKRLMKNEFIKNFSTEINELDELLHKNKRLFKLLGKRRLLWSWQKYDRVYGYLTAIDLKPSENNRATFQLISSAYGLDIPKKDLEFNGALIREFEEPEGSFFFSLTDRALLMSSSLSAIKSSIVESKRNHTDKESLLAGLSSAPVKLLIFNPHLKSYVEDYFGEAELFKSVEWSSVLAAGWSIDLTKCIEAKGRIFFDKSVSSRLSIFSENDAFSESINHPEQTSLHASVYFENFLQVLERLLSSGDENAEKELEELFARMQRFEHFLDFDLEEDLVKYLDNSLHYVSFRGETNLEQHVLIAKLKNGGRVEDNLEELQKRIKQRTPLLPKKVETKDYSIKYFAFNKLFQSLFKELAGKVDFPFYTIINDELIVSDKVRAIQEYIQLSDKKQTEADDLLEEVASNLELKLSLIDYLNSIKRTNDENNIFGKGAWALYSFPEFALEVARESDSSYLSNFFLTFNESYNYQKYLNDRSELLIHSAKKEILPEITKTYKWLPEDPDKKVEKGYHENGKLKFIIRIKRGNYHGNYRSYYENGVLETKGFYREGRRVGIWKYFNEKGNLVRKESVS